MIQDSFHCFYAFRSAPTQESMQRTHLGAHLGNDGHGGASHVARAHAANLEIPLVAHSTLSLLKEDCVYADDTQTH